jgi:SAM-dependent methyltransferase
MTNHVVYELAQKQWDDAEGSANLVEHFQTSANKNEAEQIVAKMVDAIEPHAVIIDLGCGPGRYAQTLSGFKTYKGYDTSENLLAVAREINEGVKGVRFVNRDLFDGADYKRPVDVALSIDTSRHYHNPLAMLEDLIDLWPAKRYLFSILHGEEDAELINGRCLATADVDLWMSMIGTVADQVDQPITGGMFVRYFVLERPA